MTDSFFLCRSKTTTTITTAAAPTKKKGCLQSYNFVLDSFHSQKFNHVSALNGPKRSKVFFSISPRFFFILPRVGIIIYESSFRQKTKVKFIGRPYNTSNFEKRRRKKKVTWNPLYESRAVGADKSSLKKQTCPALPNARVRKTDREVKWKLFKRGSPVILSIKWAW